MGGTNWFQLETVDAAIFMVGKVIGVIIGCALVGLLAGWVRVLGRYRYVYRYTPHVKFLGEGSCFFLRVEGFGKDIEVRRVGE